MTWLGGIEGAFYAQSPRRRAQLVALWRSMHGGGSQQEHPRDKAEGMDAAAFIENMRRHYSKG